MQSDQSAPTPPRRVVVTSQPLFHGEGPYRDRLLAAGWSVAFPAAHPLDTPDRIVAALADADAVVAGSERYTEAVLQRLPRLRMIARTGVGFDAIDVQAASRRGIPVTITPDANHQGVAEHALALMLALARSVVVQTQQIRTGRWIRDTPILPLRGRTLGIVGLGRIGRSLAQRALAFNMRVLAHDVVQADLPLGVSSASLEQLIRESDYLSLHVPLTPQTKYLINRERLGQMKPTAFVINTARGGLIDEQALVESLAAQRIAGAGLDVFEQEPPPADHPLWQFENVVLTAHAAGIDCQSLQESSLTAAEAIIGAWEGVWPGPLVVNPDVRAIWQQRL